MEKKNAYIVLALFFCALLGVAYVILSSTPVRDGELTPSLKEAPPAPSEAVLSQVGKSKGFAVLVSYTSEGFEPAQTTIQKGDTVRFINNSTEDLLWVAATSTAAAYPGTSACGGSAFDTCRALKKGEFWEFTFDTKGSWHYRNNSDPAKTGTIDVQ